MRASSDELRLLAQVGFWGATRGQTTAAKAIFSAIEAERPKSLVAFVGPAMIHLVQGNAGEAVACLERAVAVVSQEDKPELYAFLGLAYRVDGRSGLSQEALKRAGDVGLAQSLMSESPAGTVRTE